MTLSCCICGSTEGAETEPRFGYTVCAEHSKLSPVEVTHHKDYKVDRQVGYCPCGYPRPCVKTVPVGFCTGGGMMSENTP